MHSVLVLAKICFIYLVYIQKCIFLVANSADLDQLASSEAS